VIKEDFVNVKRNDPALHSSFELFFNYPGLWALLFYRFANFLYRRGFRFIPRFMGGMGQFLTGVDIHPASTIGRRSIYRPRVFGRLGYWEEGTWLGGLGGLDGS